ncbi:MAG: hypothetical protein WCG03_03200 [Kiritimatiellales bacterium]
MSLQINLLKKTERRYQGIVSMKVIVFSSISLLAAITVLVFLLAGISRMRVNSNLDRIRRASERIEPQAILVRNAQAATAANRKTLADLKKWEQDDHFDMFSILRAVQSRIPQRMALENLYAGLENNLADDKPNYTLRFSGRAQGELTAVEAKRQLNENAEVRGFCGEVKLVSSQRDTGEIWIFSLDGHRLAAGEAK